MIRNRNDNLHSRNIKWLRYDDDEQENKRVHFFLLRDYTLGKKNIN